MRKAMFVALVVALSAGTVAAYANGGERTVTRLGIDYSGVAPTACVVEADDLHPTELRVDCRQSENQGARVRFRFLKDVGFVRGPATVTADLHIIKGSCAVSWMVPQERTPARTARVRVAPLSYCHIRSVSGSQNGHGN